MSLSNGVVGLLLLLAVDLSRQTIPECKKSVEGTDYRGLMNVTVSGLVCQSWSSQSPHQHPNTDHRRYPDGDFNEIGNHCRNPDLEPEGPWCYTVDPDTRWEYCDVPRCSDFPECKISQKGEEYRGHVSKTNTGRTCRNWDDVGMEMLWLIANSASATCKTEEGGARYAGTVSMTKSGRPCQRWDKQAPHTHDMDPDNFPEGSLTDASNYCRNPDGEPGPWCYTLDPDVRFELCDVTLCGDFKVTDQGREYAGTLSTTTGGDTCLTWIEAGSVDPDVLDPNKFPDAALPDAANYCRNPDGKSGGPWCYTSSSGDWGFCDLPFCDD